MKTLDCVHLLTKEIWFPNNSGIPNRKVLLCLYLFLGLLSPVSVLTSQQVAVRHPLGNSHGFLLLRGADGKPLATGDSIQTVQGDRVTSHLVFRFKDGSIDDETTVFLQRGHFNLISDHHLQKGPQFLQPMEVSIDAPTGQITVRTFDHGQNSTPIESKTYHLDLPPDVSNGLVLSLLTNLPPDVPNTHVSYLATTPKPRIVHLDLEPHGKDTFSVGGAHHQAIRYVIHTDIGGVEGAIAPVVGKQPKDIRVWIVEGPAPAFVRMEGPMFDGGPVWDVKQASPIWPR